MARNSTGIHLFVYGTLMFPFRNPMHRVMCRYAGWVGNAVMEGKLYNLGAYPGAILSPGFFIHGELYEIVDAPRLFVALDRYEGDEYLREIVEVEKSDGMRVDAWVYLCRRPVRERRRIVSGDYAAFRGVRRT